MIAPLSRSYVASLVSMRMTPMDPPPPPALWLYTGECGNDWPGLAGVSVAPAAPPSPPSLHTVGGRMHRPPGAGCDDGAPRPPMSASPDVPPPPLAASTAPALRTTVGASRKIPPPEPPPPYVS